MTVRKWYPAVATVFAFALSLAAYPRLSGPIPIHWGLDGVANGWSIGPFGAFATPLLMTVLAILFWVLPDADVRRDNYEKFWTSYDIIVVAALTLCLAIHCVSLGAALGLPVPVNRLVPAIVGGFLICIGNVFPRLRSNSWIGIRTPWSMDDDQNWAHTHKLAGYMFVASGMVLFADAAMPGHWMNRIAVGSVIAAAAVAVIFSAAVSLNSE